MAITIADLKKAFEGRADDTIVIINSQIDFIQPSMDQTIEPAILPENDSEE